MQPLPPACLRLSCPVCSLETFPAPCVCTFQDLPQEAPRGWQWVDLWHLEAPRHTGGDPEGWVYGTDFSALAAAERAASSTGYGLRPRPKGALDFVRRRKLVRRRRHLPRQGRAGGGPRGGEQVRTPIGVVHPGHTLPLPWGSLAPDADWCLQVRPAPTLQAGETQPPSQAQAQGSPVKVSASGSASRRSKFQWGRLVQMAGSDAQSTGGGASSGGSSSLSRSGSSSSGRGGTGSGSLGGGAGGPQGFVLRHLMGGTTALVKKEALFCCRGERAVHWFCVEADAMRVQSEAGAPVPDWKVCVRAPLKLENRLPCAAEYFMWEKPITGGAGGGMGGGGGVAGTMGSSAMSLTFGGSGALSARPVSRQHGLVEPGESVHCYNIDVRCPVLLTWLPQGGWRQEQVRDWFLQVPDQAVYGLHFRRRLGVLPVLLTWLPQGVWRQEQGRHLLVRQ